MNPLATLVERLLSDAEVTRGGGLQSHVFAPESSTSSATQIVTCGFLGPARSAGVRQGEPGQGPLPSSDHHTPTDAPPRLSRPTACFHQRPRSLPLPWEQHIPIAAAPQPESQTEKKQSSAVARPLEEGHKVGRWAWEAVLTARLGESRPTFLEQVLRRNLYVTCAATEAAQTLLSPTWLGAGGSLETPTAR